MTQLNLMYNEIPERPAQAQNQKTLKETFKSGYDKLSPDKKELLKAANFDIENGWSDLYMLPQEYKDSKCGNGDGWLRFDNSSILGASLIIRIVYENGVHMINDPIRGKVFEDGGLPTQKRNGGSRVGIRFEGYVSDIAIKPLIPNLKKTRAEMEASGIPYRCVLTGSTTNLEIDHKQGRPFQQPDGSIDWEDVSDPQSLQFLSRTANQMKCRICTECRTTNLRPSGRNFNVGLPYLEGSSEFVVSGPGCRGCLLYDPKKFQERLDALIQANDS